MDPPKPETLKPNPKLTDYPLGPIPDWVRAGLPAGWEKIDPTRFAAFWIFCGDTITCGGAEENCLLWCAGYEVKRSSADG